MLQTPFAIATMPRRLQRRWQVHVLAIVTYAVGIMLVKAQVPSATNPSFHARVLLRMPVPVYVSVNETLGSNQKEARKSDVRVQQYEDLEFAVASSSQFKLFKHCSVLYPQRRAAACSYLPSPLKIYFYSISALVYGPVHRS